MALRAPRQRRVHRVCRLCGGGHHRCPSPDALCAVAKPMPELPPTTTTPFSSRVMADLRAVTLTEEEAASALGWVNVAGAGAAPSEFAAWLGPETAGRLCQVCRLQHPIPIRTNPSQCRGRV
jgi:hypothetical protein